MKKDGENEIKDYFNTDVKTWTDKYAKEGIPESGRLHIDSIAESKQNSCLDVGCGIGLFIIEMVKKGIPHGFGIDISDAMCNEARKTVKERGLEDQITIINDSLLEMSFPKEIGAISLHKVLCCHPALDAMLEKVISFNPDLIVITIPRSTLFFKQFVNSIFWIKKVFFSGFRPHIHKQAYIDKKINEFGYEVEKERSSFVWMTKTYRKLKL